MRFALLVVLFAFCQFLWADAATRLKYPASRKGDVVDTLHGEKIADPYRWLEDGTSAETKEWTDRQNELTRTYLDALPSRKAIRERLDSLLDTGTMSVAAPRQGHYFYTRREGKVNQAVLYVRDGVDGKDRPLVDPNGLAKDGTVTLDWYFPSDDGKLLAYGISPNGSENSTLHVRDVKTGNDLPDIIPDTRACSVAWLPDSTGFYYTHYPKAGSVPKGEEQYNRRVYFHKIGSDPAKDPLIFGDKRQPTDWPGVELSPDGRWLAVSVEQGWARNEIYFADRTARELRFQPLIEGTDALYDVSVQNDAFYVKTNEGAPKFRVFKVDPAKPERKNWKEIIAETEDPLERLGFVGGKLVATYLHNAASRLAVFNTDGSKVREIELPTLGTITGLGGESDNPMLFFAFHSYTVPATVYSVDLTVTEGVPHPVKQWAKIASDIDFSQYEVRQVKYPSKDGTQISMFLAGKKGFKATGSAPTWLYGYGGFNIALTPSFSAARFVFLEKGGILAIANLRGGSEYGEKWHKAGMLGNKQNVFDDFIAAAEYLIKEKYTDTEHLCIEGRSNGGLLVGTVLTQRPDLFKAVVCGVPLLDMLRYHRFLIAKLWIPEYGCADEADEFKWLRAYSPYHHVKPGTRYPATLIETAESDTRVDPLHARKMAARLQAETSSNAPILVRIETKAGHGAGKPRSKQLDELTDTWSFIFEQLGVK